MAESTPTARRTPRIDPAALQRHLRRTAGRAAPWLHEEIARRMADRLSLVRRQPNVRGVLAATRGNHGQAVAFAARRHEIGRAHV
mgnify:CR=1 FL=1